MKLEYFCVHECLVSSSESLKGDPRVEDIKLIQGSLCQKTAVEEDERDSENEEGESEADSEEAEIEGERKLPSVQNKFSLLADD